MESYSQIGQDKWVLSLFPKGYKGYFMDVGCHLPKYINNTYALEQSGWSGTAFDIKYYHRLWKKQRTARFIRDDAVTCDYLGLNLPLQVDYLSLDIDVLGTNYAVLKRLLDFGFEFGSITFEHNLYQGETFNQAERLPQRELLTTKGCTLVHADVEAGGNPFEDWWINKKYIDGLDTRR